LAIDVSAGAGDTRAAGARVAMSIDNPQVVNPFDTSIPRSWPAPLELLVGTVSVDTGPCTVAIERVSVATGP
jgi:hypothetical protein